MPSRIRQTWTSIEYVGKRSEQAAAFSVRLGHLSFLLATQDYILSPYFSDLVSALSATWAAV